MTYNANKDVYGMEKNISSQPRKMALLNSLPADFATDSVYAKAIQGFSSTVAGVAAVDNVKIRKTI